MTNSFLDLCFYGFLIALILWIQDVCVCVLYMIYVCVVVPMCMQVPMHLFAWTFESQKLLIGISLNNSSFYNLF